MFRSAEVGMEFATTEGDFDFKKLNDQAIIAIIIINSYYYY